MDSDAISVISLSSDSDEPSPPKTVSEVIPDLYISPSKRKPIHCLSSSDDSDVESVREVMDVLEDEKQGNVNRMPRVPTLEEEDEKQGNVNRMPRVPTLEEEDEKQGNVNRMPRVPTLEEEDEKQGNVNRMPRVPTVPTLEEEDDSDDAYSLETKKPKPAKKAVNQRNKEEKMKEKEKKKLEQAREKALKKAAADAQKMKKPGECLKYIRVRLDQRLLTNLYGGDLLLALKNAEIQYEIQEHINENSIMWIKTVNEHNCDENLKVIVTSSEKHEDTILVVMMWTEVIELIKNNRLVVHIQNVLTLNPDKKLTLVIYGLGEFYRSQTRDKQRQFKSRVQPASGNSQKADNNNFVSKYDVEAALLEIQLLKMCSHRLVETSQDLGSLVANFTKALAERPFKLERKKKEQEKLEWFAAGDSRDTVKVDKNGNGLMRLWKQQLCQFSNASLDTAEAIVSVYSSPKSLLQAYEKCASEKEAEGLLQDIPVRRGAGILTSVRRIGPELSKKVHDFFSPLALNVQE